MASQPTQLHTPNENSGLDEEDLDPLLTFNPNSSEKPEQPMLEANSSKYAEENASKAINEQNIEISLGQEKLVVEREQQNSSLQKEDV